MLAKIIVYVGIYTAVGVFCSVPLRRVVGCVPLLPSLFTPIQVVVDVGTVADQIGVCFPMAPSFDCLRQFKLDSSQYAVTFFFFQSEERRARWGGGKARDTHGPHPGA